MRGRSVKNVHVALLLSLRWCLYLHFGLYCTRRH